MKRKLFAILALIMCLSVFTTSVSAENYELYGGSSVLVEFFENSGEFRLTYEHDRNYFALDGTALDAQKSSLFLDGDRVSNISRITGTDNIRGEDAYGTIIVRFFTEDEHGNEIPYEFESGGDYTVNFDITAVGRNHRSVERFSTLLNGPVIETEKPFNFMQDVIMRIVPILGGLALFLYGMKIMGDGLEASAGSKLKSILETISKNRVIGIITGAVVTMLVQSSSATTVMVVGFVNAGLLQLSQAASVIMGANIGTTVTGVIVSLNVSEWAPLAVFVGLAFIMFSKRGKGKNMGQAILGIGLLFVGMATMSDSLRFLRSDPTALSLFEYAENPIIGLLIGAVFTALVQSSSAVTGIVIALGMSGALTLPQAVFIIYGSNIGTCITALISSLGASKAARRAGVIHILFNVIGSVVFAIITVLPLGFVAMIENLRPDEVAQQIALIHVIFNLATTVLIFPFANLLVRAANAIVPEGADEIKAVKRLLYIDERVLGVPHVAVQQVHREVERMARLASENYKLSIDTFLNRNDKHIETIQANEELINFLNHEITKYLVKLGATNLESKDRKFIGSLHHVITDVERIGDHAENIMEFSVPFFEDNKMFSAAAVSELKNLAEDVEQIIESTITYFVNQTYNKEEVDRIIDKEEAVDDAVETFKNNHVSRLHEGVCSPTSGMLFVNMLSDLERVSDHAANIALSLNDRK